MITSLKLVLIGGFCKSKVVDVPQFLTKIEQRLRHTLLIELMLKAGSLINAEDVTILPFWDVSLCLNMFQFASFKHQTALGTNNSGTFHGTKMLVYFWCSLKNKKSFLFQAAPQI